MIPISFVNVANVIDIAHASGVDKVGLITAKIEVGRLNCPSDKAWSCTIRTSARSTEALRFRAEQGPLVKPMSLG